MAYTTINKSTDYFNTKLYTGNNSTNAITGIGHKPDLVWVKKRNASADHILFDAVRGVQKGIFSSRNSGQEIEGGTRGLNAFNSDGFTLGAEVTQMSGSCNDNNDTYASWNWKANGAGSANTDGGINSTVSANTTSGFSIVQYTGTGSGATVGHGLGVKPKIIFFKNLDSGTNWVVQSTLLANRTQLVLNGTDAQNTDSRLGNLDSWSNSVFSLGTYGDMNGSGSSHIAYCFAEKQGYSKFGTYIGNGSVDGTFCYTGFKPAFVMRKSFSSGHNGNWLIHDTKRSPFNEAELQLSANATTAEETSTDYNEIDILSNGFKMRGTGTWSNGSGRSYIYIAFAEAPLVGTNNVPATAR